MFESKKLLLKLADVVLVLLLLSPIFLYAYQFGFGLWDSHQQWAEMGSALGGIYSPILMIIMLFLVYRQVVIQRETADHQAVINRVNKSQQSFNFFLSELQKYINWIESDELTRNNLNTVRSMTDSQIADLKLNRHENVSPYLQDVVNIWIQLYAVMIPLVESEDTELSLGGTNLHSQLSIAVGYSKCYSFDRLTHVETNLMPRDRCLFWKEDK